jgi:hypothetical protein
MTHPIGSIVYQPQPTFNFPRSYIYELHVFSNNDNPCVFVDNEIIFSSFGSPNFHMYVKLRDNFMAWNSNVYSLNYIIEWWYYKTSSSSPEFPYGGVVRFEYLAARNKTVLTVQSDVPNTHHYFDIEQQPSTYWLPKES